MNRFDEIKEYHDKEEEERHTMVKLAQREGKLKENDIESECFQFCEGEDE